MPGIRSLRDRLAPSRRTRQVLIVVGLSAGSVVMIWWSWRASVHGEAFTADLLMNIGAGLGITLATYIVLNPLFRDLQTPTIIEHPRLDRDALIDQFAKARDSVSILETWTDMLEGAYHDRFVFALQKAARTGSKIRILLLDPDSIGAQVRRNELGGSRDVQAAILSNINRLVTMREELGENARSRIQVRIYSAAPSIQMYGWDDKAFISFFPLHQSNFSVPQIETFMSTSLGDFVQRRFDELWRAPTTRGLERITSIPLYVTSDDGESDGCESQFIELDGVTYIAGSSLIRLTSRYGINHLTVWLQDPDDEPEEYVSYRMRDTDEVEPSVRRRVIDLLAAKYGGPLQDRDEQLVVLLTPSVPAITGI